MFIKYNLMGLIWGVFIFIIMVIPVGDPLEFKFIFFIPIDVAVHIFLYGVFTCLLIRGFAKQYSFPGLRSYNKLASVAFSVFYGMIIEAIQGTLIQSRSFEFKDIFSNFGGCIIGAVISKVVLNRN